jgi:excisionase family DNA binding protein
MDHDVQTISEVMKEDAYRTIEQIALYYRVSQSTVRSWIRQGLIPYLKFRGSYRMKVSDIDAVFKQMPNPNAKPTKGIPVTADLAPEHAVVINPDQDV